MIWCARHLEFSFLRSALVMGIVNVTPDSFSDGGHFLSPSAAVDHAQRLISEGADILDIGGESTRPGAEPISEAEELKRVLPVIERLAGAAIPISIDTYKPEVARQAATAGAVIVNDVGACLERSAMWKVVAESELGYICMHMRGTPQTMQSQTGYADVTREVGDFLKERLEALESAGVAPEQVAIDPGIGFAKTAAQNLELLGKLAQLTDLARPILVGLSRKSFIEKVAGATGEDRLGGSIAGALWAVQHGANVVRTHDVGATVQALRLWEAIDKTERQCCS